VSQSISSTDVGHTGAATLVAMNSFPGGHETKAIVASSTMNLKVARFGKVIELDRSDPYQQQFSHHLAFPSCILTASASRFGVSFSM